MSIISRLREKSWETPGVLGFAEPSDYRPSATHVGLWVYLGVATVLFSLITAAYLMRMGDHGATIGSPPDWHGILLPTTLWINTGVLILASIAWEAARMAARAERPAGLRHALLASGALGFLFLAGQILVWRQLHEAGYFVAGPSLCLTGWSDLGQPALHVLPSNPAVGFFYMITGIHGLHIVGGLAAWGRTIVRAAGGIDVSRTIGLGATYWHFLLAVWLAMFGLLLST
jgi:cytochrome c oxidase subunit 3